MSGERLEPGSSDAADVKPGEVLARARDEAGITQREVSDALHLPINTVAAIESGDRTELPADVFTRGYVRAYAKLLELDPDPLVAALNMDQHTDDDVQTSEQSNTRTVAVSSMSSIDLAVLKQPYVLLAATAVIAVGLLGWVLSGDGADENLPGEAAEVVDNSDALVPVDSVVPLVQEVEPQPSSPAQESVEQANATQANPSSQSTASSQISPEPISQPIPRKEPEPVAVAEPSVAEVETDNNATSPSQLEAQASGESNEISTTLAAAVTSTEPKRLTPDGDDRLSIEFSEECWVEIKDAAGTALFGDLGQAGERIDLIGAAPFRVLLGYAPGVLLTYNAEPVALTPHTRNNVASLVLGQ